MIEHGKIDFKTTIVDDVDDDQCRAFLTWYFCFYFIHFATGLHNMLGQFILLICCIIDYQNLVSIFTEIDNCLKAIR